MRIDLGRVKTEGRKKVTGWWLAMLDNAPPPTLIGQVKKKFGKKEWKMRRVLLLVSDS